MATLTIPTEEGAHLERELAGPGSRSAAALLDLVLQAGVYTGVLMVGSMIAAIDPTAVTHLFVGMLMGLGVGLPVLWQVLFAALGRPTPGKGLLGLEVVDLEGAPAGLRAHFVRAVFLPVELVPLPLPIGLMAIFVEPSCRRLGDLVAGTMVLRRDERPEETVGRPSDGVRSSGGRRARRRRRRAKVERLDDDEALTEQLTPARLARLGTADREYLGDLMGRSGLRTKVRDDLYQRSATYFCDRLGFDGLPVDPELEPADGARHFLRHLERALP